jgi:hypothetical protein
MHKHNPYTPSLHFPPSVSPSVLSSPTIPLPQPVLAFDPFLRSLSFVLDNMTHLLNSLRQHQARQATIVLLRQQVADTVAKADKLESLASAAQALLHSHQMPVAAYTEPHYRTMSRAEAHRGFESEADGKAGAVVQAHTQTHAPAESGAAPEASVGAGEAAGGDGGEWEEEEEVGAAGSAVADGGDAMDDNEWEEE